jgi:hypothetical protein
MNSKYRRPATFAALLLGLTALTGMPADPARAESLPEAVKTALTTFPSIDEAKANRRAQDYELKQPRASTPPRAACSNVPKRWRRTPSKPTSTCCATSSW